MNRSFRKPALEFDTKLSRRRMLASTAGGAVLASLGAPRASASQRTEEKETDQPYRIVNGRIRQSVMGWCFDPMDPIELARHGREIGMAAVEGIDRRHYDAVRKLGLEISLVGSHGFAQGPCDRSQHEMCARKLREAIDLADEIGCPSVITFTGMRVAGSSDREMSRNCVDLWKSVVGHAEQKEVNLCLEHLNTRDDSHPMKGHPGYFGDDVDHCVDLIKQVDSARMKLLFDVYHVQIMNGDVIRRIGQYKDVIGHYHTAGNPGRGELDENQEINYPAVMRAILKTGYTGYVAQEFIPTWEDKIAALRQAVRVCDV